MNRVILLLSLFGFFLCEVSGQDIHFSQYYNIPLNINPALTGAFEEDIRIAGNYRSQWQSVPVPFKTFSAAFDMKYFHNKFENGYFAFGGIFNRDQAGDSEMSLSQVNLTASYTQVLSDLSALTAGFQLGFGQRAFDMEKLRFENQWTGDAVDPSLPTREPFNGKPSVGFMDIGGGLNLFLKTDDDGKTFVNIGTGLFHLNTPNRSFDDNSEVKLPMRISTYAYGQIGMTDKIALVLHLLGHFHGPNKEFVGGAGIKYQLRADKGNELALQFMSTYRQSGNIGDAVIPGIEVHYRNWRMGLSYDINISEFTAATNGRGGPEISLIHLITKVKPVKAFKSCPIF